MKKGKIHGGRSLLYKRCECSCVCPPQERKWQANDEWMRGAACGLNYRGIGGLVLPLFPFNVLGHTLCNAVQSNPNLGDNTVPGDARRPIITVQLEACLCLSTFCQESQIQRREEKWEPCRNNGVHTSKPNKWRVEAWVWVMDQTSIAPTTIFSLSGFENKVGICPDFFFSYCASLCYVNTCACFPFKVQRNRSRWYHCTGSYLGRTLFYLLPRIGVILPRLSCCCGYSRRCHRQKTNPRRHQRRFPCHDKAQQAS